jgi:peptide deformylase
MVEEEKNNNNVEESGDTEHKKEFSFSIIPAKEIEDIVSEDVVEEEAAELNDLAYEMIDYCLQEKGLGLAAPQIGIFKNLFVMVQNNKKGIFETVFNPTFYKDGGKTNTVEGCLSYPGEHYYLKRFKRIGVIYYLWNGEKFIKKNKKLTGMPSIIFQHETCHLRGKTIKTMGELIDDDKIKKRKDKNGKDIKVPSL